MRVVKRNGDIEAFDQAKIRNAISKANHESSKKLTDSMIDNIVKKIVDTIRDPYSKYDPDRVGIEDIQDLVENNLIDTGYAEVAKKYIIYRYQRALVRESKKYLMDEVAEKLEAKNVQNQNANVDERSFGGRMGEASRAVTKDYALNHCMSEMAKMNHLNNEIYIHDLDSYAVGMHNCYDSSTKFITKNGIKRFGECSDGQIVQVVDKNGNWKKATVRKYGKQKMYDLTFTSSSTTKKVTCTRNHRWILEDGTVTENIQVGDSLALAPQIHDQYEHNDLLWCFGFVIGDGSDFYMKSKDKSRITNSGMQVRLCGKKVSYLDKFLNCGWSIRQKHSNGDITVISRGNGAFKQVFLDNKIWKMMSYNDLCNIFDGYAHADAHLTSNGSLVISTADIRIKHLVEDISSVCGFYVWSQHKRNNNTNFKDGRVLYELYLVKKQSTKWTLSNIAASRDGDNGYKTAWCVEEPTTHTFTLDGAMVTGNCLSIPFDDLLANGFNTRQADVRPAQSVSTAFQLVAVLFQLQSLQQFG